MRAPPPPPPPRPAPEPLPTIYEDYEEPPILRPRVARVIRPPPRRPPPRRPPPREYYDYDDQYYDYDYDYDYEEEATETESESETDEETQMEEYYKMMMQYYAMAGGAGGPGFGGYGAYPQPYPGVPGGYGLANQPYPCGFGPIQMPPCYKPCVDEVTLIKDKKKLVGSRDPRKKLQNPQGLNFDFLPHDDLATEVTMTIEPDEPEPLHYAIENGIMPIICCYMPSSLAVSGQGSTTTSMTGSSPSSGYYGSGSGGSMGSSIITGYPNPGHGAPHQKAYVGESFIKKEFFDEPPNAPTTTGASSPPAPPPQPAQA